METAHSFSRSDMAAEADRRGGAAYLVRQYGQLVVNSLVDRSLEASAAVAVLAEHENVLAPEE